MDCNIAFLFHFFDDVFAIILSDRAGNRPTDEQPSANLCFTYRQSIHMPNFKFIYNIFAANMTRNKRKCTVHSHDEYMSEEHTGQERHGQNVAASEDQIDSDGDIEVNVQGNSKLYILCYLTDIIFRNILLLNIFFFAM